MSKIESKAPDRAVSRAPENLSDAEILRMFDEQETGEFGIDPDIVPEGMMYEWKRYEVYGKDDISHLAEMRRMGWTEVPHDRHDGYFAPPGTKGPIIRKGMVLMELPEDRYKLRQRFQIAKARQQVHDKEEQLCRAPPGTGPRDVSAKIQPRVRRGYEALPVE